MSLNYPILNKKKVINKDSTFDGTQSVKCLDLLSKTIQDFNMNDFRLITVSKEYIARPDLIALAVYGNDSYGDIICKANGISNPFELNEGMVLLCPDPGTIMNMLHITPEDNKFVNNPKEDSILINSKKLNKKTLNQKRSPMEATIFDSNYTIVDGLHGLVFY